MTTNKVAYLITCISYSCIYNYKGTIEEELLDKFLLDEVSEYIINNSCSTKFEFVSDVSKFWERYGGYNVWEAYCVKNNNWINVKPSDEDILLNIYEMTKSFETFDENIYENINENFDESLEEIILEISENNISKINISEIDEDIIDVTTSSDSLFGEDIEIDWNTISNQEQERQQEEWED